MEWIDQAKMLRQGGMRVLQIAEILGLPPAKVREVVRPPAPAPYVRETSHAPAPLPAYPYRTPSDKMMADIRSICAEHGVDWEDVRGHCRKRSLVFARRAICVYLRDVRGWSFPRIGLLLDGRDHTTIIHNVRMGRQS